MSATWTEAIILMFFGMVLGGPFWYLVSIISEYLAEKRIQEIKREAHREERIGE